MSVLSSIEPQNVFHYFEEICSIPHGSGHTDAISNYLTAFAEAHELKYIKDASNNVIIFKPGTSGYETSTPVILQGHMDMVAVKEKDCPINMDTDGLKLKLENGIISAEGTTLGGDDGIAVAFALAILDSHDIPHPPLEAVFTVDEEIGMLGAAALDCSPLSSRIMLNLDSEDEGYLLVSCAGGATADVQIPVIWENTNEKASAYKLSVSHACGGHSGVEINKQSANASKVLGRVLNALANDFDMKLSTLSGGLKDNAIPTDAEAVVIFSDTDMSGINTPDHANIPANPVHSSLQDLISKWNQIIRHEYTHTDPDICITLEPVDLPAATMTDTSTHTVIDVLMTYPNGVRKMSKDIAGLVQTSLNLGILSTIKPDDQSTNGIVSFKSSVRSSIGSEKDALLNSLKSLATLAGGTLTVTGDYPAWEYREVSPLRDLMVKIFKQQYGKEPVIQALHAGVECGIFASKLPGLDCVSFGPDMDDIHTTNESMNVESVRRTWEYTLKILKELK